MYIISIKAAFSSAIYANDIIERPENIYHVMSNGRDLVMRCKTTDATGAEENNWLIVKDLSIEEEIIRDNIVYLKEHFSLNTERKEQYDLKFRNKSLAIAGKYKCVAIRSSSIGTYIDHGRADKLLVIGEFYYE